MSTTINDVRPSGRRSILAAVATPPATRRPADPAEAAVQPAPRPLPGHPLPQPRRHRPAQAVAAGVAGGDRLGRGLLLVGAGAALARLAGAVLLVVGAAVAGTLLMGAKLVTVVVRIAVLTWAVGRPGQGGDAPMQVPPPPQRR